MTILTRSGIEYCNPAITATPEHAQPLPPFLANNLLSAYTAIMAPRTVPALQPFFTELAAAKERTHALYISQGFAPSPERSAAAAAAIAHNSRGSRRTGDPRPGTRIPDSMLTILERLDNGDRFLARCDCGSEVSLLRPRVTTVRKLAYSCGCKKRPVPHY